MLSSHRIPYGGLCLLFRQIGHFRFSQTQPTQSSSLFVLFFHIHSTFSHNNQIGDSSSSSVNNFTRTEKQKNRKQKNRGQEIFKGEKSQGEKREKEKSDYYH
ncbi:hypothetical protein Dimus_016636 [Dionaea muscipula]